MKYKNTLIQIEQCLFDKLESTINEYNQHLDIADDNRINMDKAVFLIDYIRLKSFQYKDKLVNGHIRLHSKILNDFLNDELKKYKNFLVNYGFIKTIPYNIEAKQSAGYKVVPVGEKEQNVKSQRRKFSAYEFLNPSCERALNKKITNIEEIEQRKRSADRATRHLTKWLNGDSIKIDWEKAYEWIDQNDELNDEQKFFYSYAVERIRFSFWQYSRSGKDNRLHSNLTNLPSELRRFITVNGTELVSLDIKTSQPYLLAGVFHLLTTNKNKLLELVKSIKTKYVKDKVLTVMNLVSLETHTIKGFKAYEELICNTDIYNYIAGKLDQKFVDSIRVKSKSGTIFRDKVFNKHTKTKKSKDYKDLRSYCKTLTLEYMYCCLENTTERIKHIKKAYPKPVNDFINNFKFCEELRIPRNSRNKRQWEKIKKSRKSFPIFLQQLEAGILLDIITKELSKLYPKMFMATIHDSIVVPVHYADKIKPFFEKRMEEILGIAPNIKAEYWNNNNSSIVKKENEELCLV